MSALTQRIQAVKQQHLGRAMSEIMAVLMAAQMCELEVTLVQSLDDFVLEEVLDVYIRDDLLGSRSDYSTTKTTVSPCIMDGITG